MDNLIQRIEHIMNDERLFRNPELTIRDVAKELATNRLYVSRAINTIYGFSFTSYINRKRIDYAIALMKEHPLMTLENIANESGFLSEKSFFRKFREVMGDSPRAYMKKLKNGSANS
ncbi:MAG: AraC family transcriptional regulator [Bacteroidales bacterium]|nr:AraC family transcriptional regulator [Bacteroidales bacterium]